MVKVTKSTSSNTIAPPISQVSLGQASLPSLLLVPLILKSIPIPNIIIPANPKTAMNATYKKQKHPTKAEHKQSRQDMAQIELVNNDD